MKIDLQSIDREQFYVNEHIIGGEVCYLVNPKQIGAVWNKDNVIYRSSLWNYNGELISAGFKKFTNLGEKPDVFPVPASLKGCTVVEKLDGSLLSVTRYKDNYIIRTRGSIDATHMELNGHEIEIFKSEILPKIDMDTTSTWDRSYIFEWTSPLNRIVISYGDTPKFTLIGIVNHSHYSYWTQSDLDLVAKNLGLLRPPTYKFNDITELVSSVEKWENLEGVCIYSGKDQFIHKCKSFQYLKLHRFKSEATFENTVELFFEFGMPSYQEFETQLVQKFDYECFVMVRGFISTIIDGYKDVLNIVNGMNAFVNSIKSLPTRREQAQRIISSYGGEGNNRSGMVFTLLDGKSLDRNQLMKLLYQVTKK